MMRGMTLAEYLQTSNLSHADFAKKLEVSQVTVHRWVNDKRFPSKEMLIRIEIATGSKVRPQDWFRQQVPA